MKPINTLTIIAGGAALAVSYTSSAEPAPERLEATSYAWRDPAMKSEIGVSAIVGGGITGFTDKVMRDVMPDSVAWLWNVRATIGSHIPIGLDVAYVGTGSSLKSLTGGTSATLIGTTVEAAARWNALPHYSWNPYAFAGVGWQRYDVTGATFSKSDNGINDSDNSVVFPMGVGLAYRNANGLVIDAHGTFRASTNAGLVLESASSTNYAPLHTWEASASVGYEY